MAASTILLQFLFDFSDTLYNDGFSKAGALRKASLRARDRYHDPARWSAFTLIGEAI